MRKKTKDPENQFRQKGFLSQASTRAKKHIRQGNKDWFNLADKLVWLLQEIALRTSESVKGKTLDAPVLATSILLRSTGLSQAAILLIERGMAVEARIMIRSLLENAFCIAAITDNEAEFIKRFKKDHTASQKAQASFILKKLSEPGSARAKNLESFLKQLEQGSKNLSIKELAELGPLNEQYLLYRVLSNDSSHPSATSLLRHYRFDKDGWNGYRMGAAEDNEVAETLWYLALSIMPICVGVMQITKNRASNKKLTRLIEQYEVLYAKLKPRIDPSSTNPE
jgi:hypothetical protein